MWCSKEQADKISGGVMLLGMAAMFYTGNWFPGIFFVCGAASLIEGLLANRGWYAVQGALWLFGFGVLFMAKVNFLVGLFVLLGVSSIMEAFVKQPFSTEKPKIDNTLE